MHYDIAAYNRTVVASEQEMLLFNLGRLSRDLPPHFMMVSEVDQQRQFAASATFQWTHLWNTLATPSSSKTGFTKGSNTYQIGPFAASTQEQPLIKFIPIQGNEFGQRFESSLTDRLSVFLEDQRWYATPSERVELIMLFAQSLYLVHGDADACRAGLYFNRPLTQEDSPSPTAKYADMDLLRCVKAIVQSYPYFEVIDGSREIPTSTSDPPKASDVVQALQQNYKWTTNGSAYVLTNPVKIPAYLDYKPWYPPAAPADQVVFESNPPQWWLSETEPPLTTDLSKLPANYQWRRAPSATPGASGPYVLIPNGFEVRPDQGGEYRLIRPQRGPTVGEQPLRYTEKIVKSVWPVWQDYFYVELRKGLDGDTAERACFDNPNRGPANAIVCGYFKVGNFLDIMQRFARKACGSDASAARPDCIVGVGPSAPAWADVSASYTYRLQDGKEMTQDVWVPAHDPSKDDPNDPEKQLARRDRQAFFTLYKLYQMSLVDTSKLVTGTTPVTIGK